MIVANPVSLIETSKFKKVYSSIQNTGEPTKSRPLLEEYISTVPKPKSNSSTVQETIQPYTSAISVRTNSQKSISNKAMFSVMMTNDFSFVIEKKNYTATTNPKNKVSNYKIEVNGIELEEVKTYNKSETATNEREEIFMLQEMYGSIIKFENKILKLSYLLTITFLVLAFPIFLGYSSLVGVVMSLGLLLYVKIRRWERSEIYGRKSH